MMPLAEASQLAEAAGCEVWIVPNATHAQGMSVAGDEYLKRLIGMARKLK